MCHYNPKPDNIYRTKSWVVTYHGHFRKESPFSLAGLYQTDSYIQLDLIDWKKRKTSAYDLV